LQALNVTTQTPRPLRLAYLSLETPLPGQAVCTHVHEIIAGLEANGWTVERYFASRSGASARRSVAARLLDYSVLQTRVICALSRFDALYIRGHFMALPAALAARAARKVVVHEVNGVIDDVVVTYPWMRRLRSLAAALQRQQFRAADALIAVTPGLAAWAAEEAGHLRVHVVPNGANIDLFTPDGPRYTGFSNYVVFVGGLVRWHGITTMLAALQDKNWPPDVNLVIIGEGIEHDLLARAEPREPRLRWFRRQDYTTIPMFLRGALAALVPIENTAGRSDCGVLPLKLFEAMACGVPVIATDLPAQGDLVRSEEAGLVVPVGDASSLARAVATLRADPKLASRTGQAGARAVRERHSWPHRADAIDIILRDLCRRSAS
jgi:glycosyltransferase involved in cell wall biosynthesis